MTTTVTVAEKLSVIRSLEKAGYILVPLCSPTEPHEHIYAGKAKVCGPRSMGKVPPKYGWQRTRHAQYAPEALAQENANYGVVLRPSDLIIDIDPRNFTPNDRPYSRLLQTLGVSVTTFTVRSGSGGFHIYLRKPEDVEIVKSLEAYPGIDFLSAGQQIVGPSCLHAIAKQFYTVKFGSPEAVADAPKALLDLIRTENRPSAADLPPGRLVDDLQTRTRFADYLRTAPLSVKGAHGDETAFKVAAHGRDLGLPPQTTLDLMLEFWNPRCSPNWVAENLQVKVFNAYRYGKGAVGQDHPAADFEPAPQVASLKEEPTVSWVFGANNKVVKCFRNLLNYFFDASAGLKGVFAYNEFSVRAEFAHGAPWHRGKLPICRGVTDHDLHMLKGFLAQRHRYEVSIAEIESAIANAADTQKFHPVREYLSTLKWDGKPRLDTWLVKYLGAKEEAGAEQYLAAAGRKVLCAAVMRVLRPGCEFHHVLVIEGPQDLGKSSTIKILGGDWASDAPVDPHSRDTVDALQGRWIVEMAELEVFRKADEDALKAFITRPTDRVRLAYGRMTGEYPRQCVFIASKNPKGDYTYLKDETGNRRWWPVYCEGVLNPVTKLKQVDFDGLRAVRDQLFAEAVHLMTQVKPREPLSMHTPELKAQQKAVVDRRLNKPEWLESISSWISLQQSREETKLKFVTALQVYKSALQGDDKTFLDRQARAVARVMRELGWEKCHGRQEGVLHNGWRPPLEAAPPVPPSVVIVHHAPAAKKAWASLL